MTENVNDTEATSTLRLVWPQWQGAGRNGVAEMLAEFSLDEARCGYAFGSRVLQAILPDHDGPTEVVPVADSESDSTDGVESLSLIHI